MNHDDVETDLKMPFGKYKGVKLTEISTDYLDWVLGQTWLKEPLKGAIKKCLESRSDWRAM